MIFNMLACRFWPPLETLACIAFRCFQHSPSAIQLCFWQVQAPAALQTPKANQAPPAKETAKEPEPEAKKRSKSWADIPPEAS